MQRVPRSASTRNTSAERSSLTNAHTTSRTVGVRRGVHVEPGLVVVHLDARSHRAQRRSSGDRRAWPRTCDGGHRPMIACPEPPRHEVERFSHWNATADALRSNTCSSSRRCSTHARRRSLATADVTPRPPRRHVMDRPLARLARRRRRVVRRARPPAAVAAAHGRGDVRPVRRRAATRALVVDRHDARRTAPGARRDA